MTSPHLTILIADDHRDTADTLALLLQSEGHHTAVVYDGQQAADAARAHCPQMAILDIQMPGLDGWSAAAALRRACDGLVFIAAHSAARVEDVDARARASGFDRFLPKPMTAEDLFALVAQAQARAQANGNASRAVPPR